MFLASSRSRPADARVPVRLGPGRRVDAEWDGIQFSYATYVVRATMYVVYRHVSLTLARLRESPTSCGGCMCMTNDEGDLY